METIYCPDATPTFYGLFDISIAPALLYYSYIPIIFIVLVMSLIVLRADRNSLQSKLFAALALSFTLWFTSTILQWIAAPVSIVMFAWELLVPLEIATFVFATYFLYVFLNKRDIPNNFKILFVLLSLPIIILIPTKLNIEGFDIMACEGWVSSFSFYYSYILDGFMILLASFFGIKSYLKRETLEQPNERIIAASLGTVFFMTIFFATSLFGDIFFEYEIELMGPTGMVIFLGLMLYLMVRFKAFGSKILATEVFVGVMIMLSFAMFFVQRIEMVRIITSVTLIFSLGLGFLLILSVKREVKQRNEIETFTKQLRSANKRLKILDQMKSEFVSIASHQLRSPLTSIRGYASMLLEGSYGKLSVKATEAIEHIQESSRFMALSVEDYLNVSRIQAGNMKYEMADFTLTEVASKIVDDIRSEAVKNGLVLLFKSDMKKKGVVHADLGKTIQILHNLINNSLKYTPKGSVTVFAHDEKNLMHVDVVDTGIGMSKETMDSIFAKFERAHNANEVNVTGTGLGLYVALKMAEKMNGTVGAFSDGEGEGSTFRLTLPIKR